MYLFGEEGTCHKESMHIYDIIRHAVWPVVTSLNKQIKYVESLKYVSMVRTTLMECHTHPKHFVRYLLNDMLIVYHVES